MIHDPFTLLISSTMFFVYGSVFIISFIFTFSLDLYRKIDEKIKREIVPARIVTGLDKNIDWFDNWLMAHNKAIGPVLILFSILNIKFSFDVIKIFKGI
ncbi:MAG: hypothetical protein V1739_09950 [Candidatus Omnitrophota bacterium]